MVSAGAGGEGGRSFYKRISEQERNEIVSAVERAQGNIAHAARCLGINRSTLYYRMRKHNLEHLLPTKDEPPAPDPAGAVGLKSIGPSQGRGTLARVHAPSWYVYTAGRRGVTRMARVRFDYAH